MKPLNVLISELRAVDDKSPTYAATFECVLAKIVALRTVDAILPLLSCFDDDAPYDEVMFSIIHGIETFDDKAYLEQVLRGSVDLCANSPRWASILFMRILNAETCRHELVRQLRDADQKTKIAIKDIMEKINARSVRFLEKTTPVIAATL